MNGLLTMNIREPIEKYTVYTLEELKKITNEIGKASMIE